MRVLKNGLRVPDNLFEVQKKVTAPRSAISVNTTGGTKYFSPEAYNQAAAAPVPSLLDTPPQASFQPRDNVRVPAPNA